MDFLLFFLPLSVAGNVALILTVIDDIKKAREKEIRIRSLEADVWHYRSKKYRKVVRFLDPQTSMRDKFSEDVKTLQDEGWTFDESLSVNGHMAFYKEEEIKGKFID
jgi:hypothetical protein